MIGRTCPNVKGACEGKPAQAILRHEGEGKKVLKRLISRCQEKLLTRSEVPVPQTDTGR